MTINVGVNGMGRIGRMVIRAIIESQNKNIQIRASSMTINDKMLEKLKNF